jgi:chaperonin GroEL
MKFDNSPQKLLFREEARSQLLEGVKQLADAVSITMGPGGQTVVIDQGENQFPILTKDGVTVAKYVNLPNRMQNLGAKLVKQAAQGAAEIAGDGTTTSTVLAYHLFAKGVKAVNAGVNPVLLRKGMLACGEAIITELSNTAKPVKTDEEIIQVGTISANGEREIGELLCEAMNAVGRDGVITVEEAKGFKTSLTTVEGTRLDRGFISPYFINDDARGCVRYEKPYILLANRKFSSIKEVLPLLEKVHQSGKPLLIIADEVEGEALQGLVVNNQKGILKCCVIRAPEFGSGRVQSMEDLAFLLKTKVLTTADEAISRLELSELGTCEKVLVTKSETLIVGTPTSKEQVKNYCGKISDALLEPGMTSDEKGILNRRLVRLSGGVAILRVGGSTEAELRERKDRVEDALYATRAAVRSGILEGGGTSLLRASRKVKTSVQDNDFLAGWNLMIDVASAPLYQIVKNAGRVPEVIIEKTLESKTKLGYDARNDKFVDMVKCGIVDPTLVVTSAIRHATSAADNLLSTGCAMHSLDENSTLATFENLSE